MGTYDWDGCIEYNGKLGEIRRAVESERERCAAIAEKYSRASGSVNGQIAAGEIARQIRDVPQR